jgi:hypothetical protein
MRRIAIGSVVALTFVAMTAASAASPTRVLDDPKVNEVGVAASVGYFAWSSNSERHPGQYNTYVRPSSGGPATRVNPKGTTSDNLGIEGSTVVYQVYNGSDDNLQMYDAATHTRSGLPQINTRLHEYQPSLSGDWLLYTRSKPDDWTKVILFNLSTEHRRVLSQASLNWAYLRGQQVNGDWAVFEHCRDRHYRYSNCDVFRYQISTAHLVKIPNPGLQQYAPSVSHDGTVYFTRTGRADVWECGLRARIVRYPVGGPGVVIATIRAGFEPIQTRATDKNDGSTTLYFERASCRSGLAGIYRLANADTAT